MKEFPFTDTDFATISEWVYDACGIVLGSHKREMVYSRLTKRIRLLKLDTFKAYLDYVEAYREIEFSEFINALTTNLTSFFREQHHFDYLREHIVPLLLERNRHSKRIRIWSAGCSTGEEPYSIAMTINDLLPCSGWDIKILATDLDSNVLTTAQAGCYAYSKVEGLSPELIKRCFLRSADGEIAKVKPEIMQLIHFKRLNLLEPWPMKGLFDVIFCRNVVIYFDKVTKDRLFNQFARQMSNDGYLFLGHSESMGAHQSAFKNLGKTMYRKVDDDARI